MILHKLYQGYAIIVEAAPVTGNHARILLDGKLVHTTERNPSFVQAELDALRWISQFRGTF
jgi:hypothetical protein